MKKKKTSPLVAFLLLFFSQVAEGVDTALALADLIRKIDRSYRIDLKYAIIFGGETLKLSILLVTSIL